LNSDQTLGKLQIRCNISCYLSQRLEKFLKKQGKKNIRSAGAPERQWAA